MNKFKVGDKVKINKKIISFKYGKGGVRSDVIGKIIGVTENNEYYVDFPLAHCWHGLEKELELVEKKYTYEDLKKSPIGTKITFEDGKTLVKVRNDNINDSFTDINAFRSIRDLKGLKDSWLEGYFGKIIKIEEPTYQTVYEANPEILDETEKRYLRGVIRPFRDRIKYICKLISAFGKYEYIEVDLGNDTLVFPKFKPNTMYKRMKVDKKYTLEELGL